MKTKLLLYVLLLCFFISPCIAGPPSRLRRIIEEAENVVTQLAGNVTDLFKNRKKYIPNCQCSMHSCTYNVTGFECNENYGKDEDLCGKICEGRRINLDATKIRTPPNTDIRNLSTQLKESICVYSNLESRMKDLIPKPVRSWIYFGGLDGSYYIYPAMARERDGEAVDEHLGLCRQYDPRLRPWFIGASTRAKDIVFVIDVSESMNKPVTEESSETRWDVTKKALNSMLDTLASFDYVNIVTFSEAATRLNTKGSLLQGTAGNLNFLKEQLESQYTKGLTNFSAGFSEAFDILEKACDEGDETPRCSQCQSVILFLTDGRDTTRPERKSIETSRLLNKIEEYQKSLERATSKRASIFTFSLGDTADDSRPRQIACANGGSWSYIGPETDVRTAMTGYYRFLTNFNDTSSPVWVNPYEDDGGLGNLTTVAKAVFSTGTEDLDGVLLGVAALDVLLKELKHPGLDSDDVLAELAKRSSPCHSRLQSPCQLQVHRNAYADEAICPDRVTTSSKINKDVEKDDTKNCYRHSSKFYVLFTKQADWDAAAKECKKDKGKLVTIDDEDALAFIAGLSSTDGSWIGARLNLKKGSFEWTEKGVSNENIQDGSSWWGLGEPNEQKDPEDCVLIDPRGVKGNLNNENCEDEFSFICEYSDAKPCDEVINSPDQGYYTIPSLKECVHEEESLVNISPLPQSTDILSEEVICPLGKSKDPADLFCCPTCLKDNP